MDYLKIKMSKKLLKDTNNYYNHFKRKRKPLISRIPRFLKFKKQFKSLILNNTQILNINKTKLQYGFMGLQVKQNGYFTLNQIDILKKFLYPKVKNKYKSSLLINLFIKLFPTHILTQKPTQARIGRGKGLPTLWYCKVYKNDIIFEFRSILNQYYCLKLIKLIAKKLPIPTRIVKNKEIKIGRLTSSVIKKLPLKIAYIA